MMPVEELARFKDPLSLDLMSAIKSTLDPAGIMNPGKLFKVQALRDEQKFLMC